jgi:hypothetical protein
MGETEPLSLSLAELQESKATLEDSFPNLDEHNFEVTSDFSENYNCIAWAANDTTRWWWPVNSSDAYWPEGVLFSVTKESFIAAFQKLGYEVCEDREFESGFEKVALYFNENEQPTHMARQLSSGVWTSKLGEAWDIMHHTLEGLEGSVYGHAALFLRRQMQQ